VSDRESIAEKAAHQTYRGVWAVARGWFRVPEQAPTLPVHAGGHVDAMRPALGYLRYLKLQFWLLFALIALVTLAAWIGLTIAFPVVGAALAIPALLLVAVPRIIAFVAMHLRYDTTWYVLSDSSMRLRRGIWVIHEATITYENVQNVMVRQGPVQRYFGIANVMVQTAGGGVSAGPHGATSSGGHHGLLEGVADAAALRDLIMDRVRASRHTGLGDERRAGEVTGVSWTPEHLDALRSIRDAVKLLQRR